MVTGLPRLHSYQFQWLVWFLLLQNFGAVADEYYSSPSLEIIWLVL